jgi:hypothetical protein
MRGSRRSPELSHHETVVIALGHERQLDITCIVPANCHGQAANDKVTAQ